MASNPIFFNPLDLQLQINPYPIYHQFREADPVNIGLTRPGTEQTWFLFRYHDIDPILKDRDYMGVQGRKVGIQDSEVGPSVINELADSNELSMLVRDPPDHTRLRGLVSQVFTPKRIEALKARVEHMTHEFIEQVYAQGQMDLMKAIANPVPAIVIAEILGVPAEDNAQFTQWAYAVTRALDFFPSPEWPELRQKANQAFTELFAYFQQLVMQRQKVPKEDLVTALVQVQNTESDKLTAKEILTMCGLLLNAGHETTRNLMSNGMLALLTHEDQRQLLQSDLDQHIVNTVDELLRYDTPVQFLRRFPYADATIGNKLVKRGHLIILAIGSANHDPEVFADPDRLDITRTNANKHLSFGSGIHHCLGAALARLEAQTMIKTLFTRLPRLKLADPNLVERRQGILFRGLESLPVTF